MLIQTQIEKVNSDDWAERCRYWEIASDAIKPARKRREKLSAPLIITGYGFVISVDKKRLIIRGGITHYPQKVSEQVLYKGSLDLPPRIVIVDGKGTISVDALDWISEQGIALIRIKYDGTSAIIMSPNGFAADPHKVAWQYATRSDPAAKLAFAAKVTREKLLASIETLEKFVPASKSQEQAINAAQGCLDFIKRGEADTASKLLGQEGKAASFYWRAWQGVGMKWRATSRHPIPDEWCTYLSRSSIITGVKPKNWNAAHPINAMLNYAYAALLTKMKIEAICDGYDPMIGILHDQRHKEKEVTASFALDLMEPHRPVVDRGILKLVAEHTFSGADFDLQSNGVVRINPQFAKYFVDILSKWNY
ncbi:MAG: CRISPR-associated endonuclease Cas1 [Hyphomonas sp.]